jgi:hypothetical protein
MVSEQQATRRRTMAYSLGIRSRRVRLRAVVALNGCFARRVVNVRQGGKGLLLSESAFGPRPICGR